MVPSLSISVSSLLQRISRRPTPCGGSTQTLLVMVFAITLVGACVVCAAAPRFVPLYLDYGLATLSG